MRELDFEKLREEKIKLLEGHHTIILATSHDNKVTARTVTYATKDSISTSCRGIIACAAEEVAKEAIERILE